MARNETAKQMKQTLEKIEQHFYSCTYQLSSGEWSTRYYGIFTDWSGKRRKFALGANLKIARRKLDRLKGENAIEKDFDAEKNKPEEGMTVAKWADCYLKLEEVKTKRSFGREKELIATIRRLLGWVLLTEIKREHLFKYRTERLQEHIVRNGKAAANNLLALCPPNGHNDQHRLRSLVPHAGGKARVRRAASIQQRRSPRSPGHGSALPPGDHDSRSRRPG